MLLRIDCDESSLIVEVLWSLVKVALGWVQGVSMTSAGLFCLHVVFRNSCDRSQPWAGLKARVTEAPILCVINSSFL